MLILDYIKHIYQKSLTNDIIMTVALNSNFNSIKLNKILWFR